MLNVGLFFKMHQPYSIKKLSIFDIGTTDSIIDYDMTRSNIEKIAELSYKPTLELLLELIKKHDTKFKFSLIFSGILIEQLKQYKPDIIEIIAKIVETKLVELIVTPYYNSLSFIFNENDFIFEVNKHINLIYSLFNYVPKTFVNTELIYNNKIADSLRGFTSIKKILTEPVESIIGFKSPINLYKAYGKNPQIILLRHNKLSDDLTFNFSNKNWKEFPLTAEKYSKWVNDVIYNDKSFKNLYCNLLFNIETFGYYLKENTGIFEFLYDLPSLVLKYGKGNCQFILPSEIEDYKLENLDIFSSKEYISMSGNDKNITSFLGNELQKNAQTALYNIIELAKQQNMDNLIEKLRVLSSADYILNMSDNNEKEFIKNQFFYSSAESAYQNFLYSLADIEEKMS